MKQKSVGMAFLTLLCGLVPGAALAGPDCSTPRLINITAPSPASGDTRGKPSNVSSYACAHDSYGAPGTKSGFTGGEEVWQFHVVTPSVVWFELQASHPDLRLFLLQACDAGACLDLGGCGENLAAGTYYLIVDGLNGAEGSYTITPRTLAPVSYQRWYDCPECLGGVCGQTPDAAFSAHWSFNSGNYCGTGCDFSLFTAVSCGTEFHLPFFDPETGHLRVQDLFRGQDVSLVARNDYPTCPYLDTGTRVAWEDRGCTQIPCPAQNCGGGSDCRTNIRRIDVQMLGAPNLCGVYKVDFDNWGGYAWELTANCTGTFEDQYHVYRDLCSALVGYRELPEIGIAEVAPDPCEASVLTGSITLENVGCVSSVDTQIGITQEPPAPPNPATILVSVPAGQQVTVPWSYTPTQQPVDLKFTVDPANQLAECGEGLPSQVSCGLGATLERESRISMCYSLCATLARPGPASYRCDSAPHLLDGSDSDFRCLAGEAPEYRWETQDGALIAGCDWSPSATCLAPAELVLPGKTRFQLRTRCGGQSSGCAGLATTAVIVGQNLVPPSLGNQFLLSKSGSDLRLEWAAPDGSVSAYRAHESTTPWFGAGSVLPKGTVDGTEASLLVPATSLAPGTSYFQLVGISCAGDLEGTY